LTELTLFVKAFNGGQLKQIDDLLKSQFEDLDVKSVLEANPTNKWVHLSLEGEDEVIATSFARKKIGTVPENLDAIEVGAELKGYVAKVDESRGQLLVDVGVYQPKVTFAIVSLDTLRAQFATSNDSTVKTITEAFGIGEGLPITVKVAEKDESLKAEIAPALVEKLKSWQQSLLDRLIILRANKELVDEALERTHLERDVIEVEQLGFFEFSLTCKLGTEARGLIPRVGRYMRNAVFVVFNSKKSIDFLVV
jgi:hypothetical protein